MGHSTHVGFNAPDTSIPRLRAAFLWFVPPPIVIPDTLGVGHSALLAIVPSCPGRPLPFQSRATGVGNNEHPVPEVGSSHGSSGYTAPFRIVPERDQVSKNVSKPPNKEPWDVFHEHVTGS